MSVFQRSNIDRVEGRIDILLEMLKETSDEQNKLEEEEMINAVVDADLITTFRQQFISESMKEAHLRQIAAKRGRYQEDLMTKLSKQHHIGDSLNSSLREYL